MCERRWPCGVASPTTWRHSLRHGLDECGHLEGHDGPHTWETTPPSFSADNASREVAS